MITRVNGTIESRDLGVASTASLSLSLSLSLLVSSFTRPLFQKYNARGKDIVRVVNLVSIQAAKPQRHANRLPFDTERRENKKKKKKEKKKTGNHEKRMHA